MSNIDIETETLPEQSAAMDETVAEEPSNAEENGETTAVTDPDHNQAEHATEQATENSTEQSANGDPSSKSPIRGKNKRSRRPKGEIPIELRESHQRRRDWAKLGLAPPVSKPREQTWFSHKSLRYMVLHETRAKTTKAALRAMDKAFFNLAIRFADTLTKISAQRYQKKENMEDVFKAARAEHHGEETTDEETKTPLVIPAFQPNVQDVEDAITLNGYIPFGADALKEAKACVAEEKDKRSLSAKISGEKRRLQNLEKRKAEEEKLELDKVKKRLEKVEKDRLELQQILAEKQHHNDTTKANAPQETESTEPSAPTEPVAAAKTKKTKPPAEPTKPAPTKETDTAKQDTATEKATEKATTTKKTQLRPASSNPKPKTTS